MVATTLRVFSGNLTSLFAATIADDGIVFDKGPRGLGILESGNLTQYCKIDITRSLLYYQSNTCSVKMSNKLHNQV